MTGSVRRYDYIPQSNPKREGKVRLVHKKNGAVAWVPEEKVAQWLRRNPGFRRDVNE